MIVDNLENRDFYTKKFPILEKAFNFILKSGDFTHAEEKKYEIDNGIYAVVSTSAPKALHEQKLEAHTEYVDLQYIIDGKDIIGWKNLGECKDIFQEYNKEKDIVFFNENPDFNIILNKGNFTLFFPYDAHAPLCGKESVIKCIIKIKMELFK